MKVVIIGASGNVGTATADALLDHPDVSEIVAVARRLPATDMTPPSRPTVVWQSADIRWDDLDALLAGADVVVHLAWLFHPSHRPEQTWENNVIGAARLLEAAERSGVSSLVASSSVAAYSPRRDSDPVDESCPTHGASSRVRSFLEAWCGRG